MARWRAPSPLPRNAAANSRVPRKGAAHVPSGPEEWKRHLGRKVSLRYVLHDDPEHAFSEAIGVVASVEADAKRGERLVLYNRRGEAVTIPVRDIVACKVFPVAPS